MKTVRISLALAALTGRALMADVVMWEEFNYPDGQLSQVATNVWVTHSGGSRPLNVSSGAAVINQADLAGGGEDVTRVWSVSFDPQTDNSTKLYAAFLVNFSALPVNTGSYTAGSYFAHFRTDALNEYYSRIGANLEGAASGKFRLAIANETWTSAASIEYPMDLSLGVTYEVVIRLDLATDQTTLWVNPWIESNFSVTATDAITYTGLINSFALRQGVSGVNPNQGAPGFLSIDNLRIATSFDDLQVIPEPPPLALLALGGAALLVWRRRRA